REDCAARHTELLFASFALPSSARRDRINIDGSAARAARGAVILGKPDFDELRVGFLVGQPENLSEGQAPCGCGEEEVLGHRQSTNLDYLEYNALDALHQAISLTWSKILLCIGHEPG